MEELINLDIAEYDISPNTGFLLENPLEMLPEYFKEWNHLAANAPKYSSEDKSLRERVKLMPLLDHNKLKTYKELCLAHLQLTAIATGYIWQEGDKGLPKVLPRNIAIPWFRISEKLGLQPVVCHAIFCLSNWKISDESRSIDISNVRCIYEVVPGGRQAEWFIIVTAMIEYTFVPAIEHIVSAIKAAFSGDDDLFMKSMTEVGAAITNMKSTLSKMHDELEPDVFYNVMRPYLNGWGGKGSALPDGLIYEGISEEPMKMTGGSAAQSSTLQLIDSAFGVTHDQDIRLFLESMRSYMPPKHARFVELVAKISNLRNYAIQRGGKVKDAFNDCLQSVINFRSYHIQIITKYIIISSNKETRNKNFESVAKKGTGGSSLVPFLKNIRDATKKALII